MNLISRFGATYKKLSPPVKASVWFAVCNVIQKGIALLTTPIFTRMMTTEQYGQYTVYQSWYSIIAVFATLNLYAGVYNNGLLKWQDDRKRFTSAMQGLSTTLTVALLVVYLVATDFWTKALNLTPLFILAMFTELLFVPAFNFWTAEQRFDYKYRNFVLLTLFIALASPILGVISVMSTEYKAEARVLSFVLVQVCVGLIFYVYNFRQGKTFYNKTIWKYALAFNLPLIPHYLAQTVLGQADRIMIERMVGRGEAAIYGVAYTISMMFNIVTNAVNNTFIPYTYRSIRDRKYKALNRIALSLYTAIGLLCIAAILFGPEIIRIIAAPEYYPARYAIPPVASALLFIFGSSLFGNVEFYYEKTRFIMVASSVAAAANVLLNYLAIPVFGYLAAAYTTLICYILLMAAHYTAYRVVLGNQRNHDDTQPAVIYNGKVLLAVSVAVLAVMLAATLLYEHAWVRYGIAAVGACICVANRKKIIAVLVEMKVK